MRGGYVQTSHCKVTINQFFKLHKISDSKKKKEKDGLFSCMFGVFMGAVEPKRQQKQYKKLHDPFNVGGGTSGGMS